MSAAASSAPSAAPLSAPAPSAAPLSAPSAPSHYDEHYFEWQKQIGVIGGMLNKFKFERHIREEDRILDFGCGGGYLLAQFPNTHKTGFEINTHAHAECAKNGIEVTDSFDTLEDNSFDVIISNHALEHVPLPLETLKQLQKKLKVGGRLVVVLPCEQPNEMGFYYKPDDINQHLHTWCPMTFGNLATLAGFNVQECLPLQHKWCPDYKENYNKSDFHARCIEYAKREKNIQIKLVATKS
jgi:SAM-dependent methyltransferase